MRQSMRLYELIESMTQTEVLHFRDFASTRIRGGKAKYLQLFTEIREVVRRGNPYDESKIKKKFPASNFPDLKKFLYQQLLRSIEALRNEQYETNRTFSLIRKISILKSKNLYNHIDPLYKKAFENINYTEDFKTGLILLDLMQRVAKESMGKQDYFVAHKHILETRKEWREKDREIEEYHDLLEKVGLITFWSLEDQKKEIQSILESPLIKAGRKQKSIRAAIIYHSTRVSLLIFQKNTAITDSPLSRVIALYESHPGQLENESGLEHYFDSVFHFGLVMTLKQNYPKALDAVHKLSRLGEKYDNAVWIFERVYLIRLHLARKQKNLEDGLKTIAEISKGMEKFGPKVNPDKVAIYAHCVAEFLLIFGMPREALIWILKNRDNPEKGIRMDLRRYSWILFLLAHYDLGNLEFIGQQLRGVRANLKKLEGLTEFEVLILHFINRLLNSKNTTETNSTLREFGNALAELFKNPQQKWKENYFNLEIWIQSHLKSRKMHELH